MDANDWFKPITTENSGTFPEFIGSDSSTVVVREPQLKYRDQHARAQLRSIPLFQLFGYHTVVHTDVWANEFQIVEYEHLASEETDPDAVSFPLMYVVTQEGIEEYAEEKLVRDLVKRSLDEEEPFILVTDTAAPKTLKYTKKPGKSIVDEFAEITVKDYPHLSSVFINQYLESRIPIVETRNVFFHATSTIHAQHDAPADSIDALFDYTRAPSDSPVWEPARYFVTHDLENVLDDYSERIREALRSWTERGDTQRVANNILEVLQVCDYDREQLEEFRKKPPQDR